ncbi:MAG: flagellar biosynthesis protein FlhA [Acidimicrobiales bacterium]
MADNAGGVRVKDARNRLSAIGIPFGVVSIVIVLVVPLPAALIDFLLAVNIAGAVVILLTSMMVAEPLQFSVFPTLLLVTTLMRLALNVSTTRLILSGDSSQIIETFGGFVVGGSIVIGLVVFLILVVIQFVVVTNGAGRVAEVSARFMLDAMPGKQMAIDADLNSGLIDEETARDRRAAVSAEADFYGSMDGASKFVKGDAIASIVIVIINLIGGISVGMVTYGYGVTGSIERFGLLTIGDGLVSQIPALLISVASGVIVTRSITDEAGGFGADLWTQLIADHRTLAVSSVSVALVGLVPGLPVVPFFALALFLGAGALKGYRLEKDTGTVDAAPATQAGDGDSTAIDLTSEMRIEALELELAPNLLDLVEPGGAGLLERVKTLRRHIALELGLVAPLVRTRDNLTLPMSTYAIRVHGVEVGRGLAPPGSVLVLASHPDDAIPGEPTLEPVFGLPASWVPEHLGPQLEGRGHSVIDRASVILTHLSEVVRSHAADLLSRQDVQDLVDALKPVAPSVANEVGGERLSLAELHQVLGALLRERVPIRDLVRILEAVTSAGAASRDLDTMVEAARRAIGPAICAQIAGDGTLHAITLDPRLEQHLFEHLRPGEKGAFLAIAPSLTEALLDEATAVIAAAENRGVRPVLLCTDQLRPVLRRLLAAGWPSLPVIAFQELSSNLNLETTGVIRVDLSHATV